MSHYTKVGVVVMRSLGLLIMLYATPVLLWCLAGMTGGVTTASDGESQVQATMLGWLFYALAGVLMFVLAKPLARFAARGVEGPGAPPPAA